MALNDIVVHLKLLLATLFEEHISGRTFNVQTWKYAPILQRFPLFLPLNAMPRWLIVLEYRETVNEFIWSYYNEGT